jgi:hypothetical protein
MKHRHLWRELKLRDILACMLTHREQEFKQKLPKTDGKYGAGR